MSDQVFSLVVSSQGRHAQAAMRGLGATSPARLELKRKALESAVRSQEQVLWPGVFMHCCEYDQAVRRFSARRLQNLVAAPLRLYRKVVGWAGERAIEVEQL